jgi:reactive intermediate/imine deaminase
VSRMTVHHLRPTGSPPTNGYSHTVTYSGTSVVVSGQVPLDAVGNLVGEGDAEAQVTQVFENLAAALAAAGAGLRQVVKLTVYLTDLGDLAAFRAVRDRYVDTARPPASTLVRVAGLVDPRFRVEIDALAAI